MVSAVLTKDQKRRVKRLLYELGFSDGLLAADEGTREENRVSVRSGVPMGATDCSLWLCPRCMVVISNLEYEHLNPDGCCKECETMLEQYEKVEWRP